MRRRSLLAALLVVSIVIITTPNARGEDIDADGPYVGDVGKPLTFNASSHAPEISLFRWDVDNDSTFDIPDNSGCGPMGCWTTNESVTHTYFDEYVGDAVVEGWDGSSTHVVNLTGTVLEGEESGFELLTPPSLGWRFTPSRSLTVSGFGYLQRKLSYEPRTMAMWDCETQSMLRSCTPTNRPNSWNWCIVDPLMLTSGVRYVLSISKGDSPFMTTDSSKIKVGPDVLTYDGYVYKWPTEPLWREGGNSIVPMIDFIWNYPETVPKSVNDTALVIVRQPRMFDFPGCSATVIFRSATINADNEPGDDEWMFRLRTETQGWRTYPQTGHYILWPEYKLPFTIPINTIDSTVRKGWKGETVQIRVAALAIEDDPYFDDIAFGSARVEGICDGSVVHSTIKLKGLQLFAREPVDVDLRVAVLFEP